MIPSSIAVHRFPLSFVQERLWRAMQEAQFTSTMTLVNHLSGNLNVPLLKKSFDEIIHRHWILKTKFVTEGDNTYQVVGPPENEFFFERDLRNLPPGNKDEAVSNELVKICQYCFDLSKSPLIRCDLVRVENQEYYIVINAHHIIFDGKSLGILRDELEELYSAKMTGRSPNLPDLPLQYSDYALWQRDGGIGTKAKEKILEYWKEILTGLKVTELPTAYRLYPAGL